MRGVAGCLDAVVRGAEAVFVGFAGFGGFGVSVFFREVGGVPVFHGDHGMVGSGQGFFGADGVYPFIGGLFVSEAQLIEIWFVHD